MSTMTSADEDKKQAICTGLGQSYLSFFIAYSENNLWLF